MRQDRYPKVGVKGSKLGVCVMWGDTPTACDGLRSEPMFRAVAILAVVALLIFAAYFVLTSLPRQLEENPCGTSLQCSD